jgi:hypothetical protein
MIYAITNGKVFATHDDEQQTRIVKLYPFCDIVQSQAFLRCGDADPRPADEAAVTLRPAG